MTGISASAICGNWQIVSSDMRGCAFLDLVEPAYILSPFDGRGAFAFAAATGATDCC